VFVVPQGTAEPRLETIVLEECFQGFCGEIWRNETISYTSA
jgi:hypothetical protein